ncbi:MAG: exo-alpha-sialidase, partial [Planctomycetales bacterium]|nr:exo-alpha-sialidase [Planctomycetales bacterium]
WVNQHAYLARFGGKFWAMWSDGPGVPQAPPEAHRNRVPGHDQAGTRVSYAVSDDGLAWSEPKDLSGPPRREGFGWIARGFWIREGQLLALAAHFNAPDYRGEGLSLEAFRWNEDRRQWLAHGTVYDDAMNNFPPRQLPGGAWMMSRRDHRAQVSVMIGGVKSFDDWQVRPLATYGGEQKPEEPYWYVLPDGQRLVGLLRDNSGSKRLLRTFSSDEGQTWSKLTRTNFPDATSKFFALPTSHDYYVLVSNSRPQGRDPLTLAVSRDGLVYTHLFYLVGGRHIDYPHAIEHDGKLLISFSGAKQTVEVLRVPLTAIDERLADRTP